MKNIMIAGAGTIGNTIAHWLASSEDYQAFVVDLNPQQTDKCDPKNLSRHQLDVLDAKAFAKFY